jgi:hypothetical protein
VAGFGATQVPDEDAMPAMKWIALFAFVLAANATAALAAEMTVDGSGALVLAALVGNQSKTISPTDKAALTRLLAGSLTKFPAEQTIMVAADKIDCKASNVDILEHSCTLTFGTMPRTIAGREAHELFATLIEAGVRPEGAAGSTHETLTGLTCTIDPNAIKQRDGSGADCKFQAGG